MNTQCVFESFPKQEEFINDVLSGKYEFILYGGAMRGGKTYVGLFMLILLCRIYPGSRWAVVREDMTQIRTNIYPVWNKLNPHSIIKKFTYKPARADFKNGSCILFIAENYKGDKELEFFKGLEVNGFLLEEISGLQEQTLDACLKRSGTYLVKGLDRQPNSIVMATCNPTWGWVRDSIFKKWEDGTLNKKFKYIQSRVHDNIPFLKAFPDFIKNKKEMLSRYEYEVFVEGNWNYRLKTGGEFFKSFKPDEHMGPLSADADIPFHVSVDNNVYPYIAITIWQISDDADKYHIRQVGEITAKEPNNTASKAGDLVKRWLDGVGNSMTVFIYGDPTTQSRNTIDDNKKTFLDKFISSIETKYPIQKRIFSKAPPVASTAEFINCIYEGKVQGLSIMIDEECRASVSDYIEVKEDSTGGMLKKKVRDPMNGITYEQYGHLSDTKRYFIVKAFESKYNEFKNRFNSFENIYIDHRDSYAY